jgi:hypothetical protein
LVFEDIAENYNRYFASRLYDQRYPRPNPSCLALIINEIGQQGTRVLDFGCGNGRNAPTRPSSPTTSARRRFVNCRSGRPRTSSLADCNRYSAI